MLEHTAVHFELVALSVYSIAEMTEGMRYRCWSEECCPIC